MNAWIFDVDGVVVDIQNHKLNQENILPFLAKSLLAKEPVILISGRSAKWQYEEVGKLLQDYISKHSLPLSILDNFYISGEFGGTDMTFSNGENQYHIRERLRAPKEFLQDVHNATQPFLEMFIIEPKETLWTAYIKNLSFAPKKSDLAILYQDLLEKYNLTDLLEIQQDTLSVNIRNKTATKSHAVDIVLSWLTEKKLKPSIFYVFGDSPADIEMGEELERQKKDFTFIFVGDPKKLTQQPSFPITFSKERYDKGVVEYLESFAK